MRYFTEIIVIVSCTTIIAYVLCLFVYYTGVNSINEVFGGSLFSKDVLIPTIGVLGVYIINLFFGLLPINRLMKKTPAEILAKYDI